MKAKLVLTISLIGVYMNLYSQSITNTDSIVPVNFKKVDPKNFKTTGASKIYPSDEDDLQSFTLSSGYVHNRSSSDRIHSWYYEYDKDGYLIKKVTSIFENAVGNTYFYDREGNVIKTKDNDVPFKFTFDDLRERMLKDFQVDIMDEKKMIKIHRAKWERFNGETIYEVEYYLDDTHKDWNNILFNGDTGEIIGQHESTVRDYNPISYYLEKLEQEKAKREKKEIE